MPPDVRVLVLFGQPLPLRQSRDRAGQRRSRFEGALSDGPRDDDRLGFGFRDGLWDGGG
jgi:hypothetical protein